MFGPGRPAMKPEITSVRELTEEDVLNFKPSKTSGLKKLRDSHHRIAHLFALGLRPGEVAAITGYSNARLSVLRSAPQMQDLIEVYRKEVMQERQEGVDDHFTQLVRARNLALGRLVDRLEDDEEEFTPNQLLAIAADGSDRTGYPKRTMALNVNMDFAARLDAAVKRSNQVKTIEGEVIQAIPRPPSTTATASTGGGREEQVSEPPLTHPAPPLLRRRA